MYNGGGYQQQQQGGGYGSRLPPQQQFGQQQQQHRGLGTMGAAQNFPPPASANSYSNGQGNYGPTSMNFPAIPSSSSWNGDKFSLFVGNLPSGLEDGWLERILGTAGPVLSLKRPSPPFGFVEYGDPESVLRCLEVINGASITGKGGETKCILVKADEKTRERLDRYEEGRVRDEATQEFLLRTTDDLSAIITLMSTGSAPSTLSSSSLDPSAPNQKQRPMSHLQDLIPDDLPVENRTIITSEIAVFRERAAARAAEKKRVEDQRQLQQSSSSQGRNFGGAPTGPGGGGGGYSRGLGGQNSQVTGNGWGARGGQTTSASASTSGSSGSVDPQAYNKPIGFVGAGAGAGETEKTNGREEGKEEKEVRVRMSDAERERGRLEQARRSADAVFRDRERRYEQRESHRLAGVERERLRERSVSELQDRNRVATRERLAIFDDAVEKERGRELFLVDRARWRSQRRPFRTRELDQESIDRQLELTQLALLRKESEDFLDRQASMFAKITESKLRAGGLPTLREGGGGEGEEAVVKLSFGKALAKNLPAVGVGRSAGGVLGIGEEEEEANKRRELIPLNYSDDEEEDEKEKDKLSRERKDNSRLSERERERKRKEVREKVPGSVDGCWGVRIKWSGVNETILQGPIEKFVRETIVQYLGAEEEELVKAVLDHLRAKKSAKELVEELEPVFDEETTEFVLKVWQTLICEMELARIGL